MHIWFGFCNIIARMQLFTQRNRAFELSIVFKAFDHLIHSRPCDLIDPSHKSHNASAKYPTMHHFCNINVHMCAHFCTKVGHCGIWDWCFVGCEWQVYYLCTFLQISAYFIRTPLGKPLSGMVPYTRCLSSFLNAYKSFQTEFLVNNG